jgi:hypothetical protein
MSSFTQKKLVGVSPGSRHERYRLLFDALGQLFPVEFRRVKPRDYHALDGLIVLDGDIPAGLAAAAEGLPAFVVADGSGPSGEAAAREVHFGNAACLDVSLRGRVMVDKSGSVSGPLAVQPGDEVLASADGDPVWLSRLRGRGACQVSGVPLPPLGEKEFLFQHLNGQQFMRLLPLMNFLRQLVKDADWQDSFSRACFVFDDPSFYRPSYGFLNYRLLAEHAAKHDFYVSVAAIPLDTWWVNRGVAATFRSLSPRLSILIHGNNHTAREMLLENNGADHLAAAAQAMRRMERLERRHGIALLKIMEAPHGAISNDTLQHLLALGYEAALCTTELLVQHNPGAAWPASLGMDRSEILGGGLPVIRRIKMSGHWRNDVVLAAFLQQPFVVAGHHWDAADRFETLVEVASFINNLKNVIWASPLEITRSNYKQLRLGDALNLKTYSRRIHVSVTEGINQIFVHRPWLQGEAEGEMLIVKSSGQEIFRAVGTGVLGPIPVKAPGLLEVCSPPAHPVDYRTVRAPKPRCWPVVRKLLMEVRDRSAPWRYRAARLVRGPKAKLPGKKDEY